MQNGKPIQESSRFTSSYDHTNGVALFKIDSTQINDFATYTAIGENAAGSANTSCKLIIGQVSHIDSSPIVNPDAFKYLEKPSTHERPREDPNDVPIGSIKPPKFVVPLTNQKLKEGTNAQLSCKVEGFPFPNISWFKDNKPLPASNRLITNYNMNSGVVSLKITDVQIADNGNYVAVAQNKAGHDQTMCFVQVQEIPGVDNTSMVRPDAFKYLEAPKQSRTPDDRDRANYQPPKFIIPLKNHNYEEGHSIQLACKVEGNPKPKVSI